MARVDKTTGKKIFSAYDDMGKSPAKVKQPGKLSISEGFAKKSAKRRMQDIEERARARACKDIGEAQQAMIDKFGPQDDSDFKDLQNPDRLKIEHLEPGPDGVPTKVKVSLMEKTVFLDAEGNRDPHGKHLPSAAKKQLPDNRKAIRTRTYDVADLTGPSGDPGGGE